MAKKYHQTREDRRHESEGMKRYERGRGMDSGFFGMISEDHNAPANLPQHVIHKMYPKTDFSGRYELDDTIRGLDDVRRDDIRNMEAHPSDSKY